jgi:histone H3/H4
LKNFKKEKEDLKMRIKENTIKEILKEEGAGRVSSDASKQLAEIVEIFARDLAKKVINAAISAKRKTIKSEDIEYVTHNSY